MHLTDGELHAYLDGETAVSDLARLRGHLEGCARCRQRAQELSGRVAWVSQRLESLEPHKTPAMSAVGAARQRLRAYQKEKEKDTMLRKIFTRSTRPVWITLGLVAILALALAFPPVRAIANSFLGLFRVQQVTVIQVNPGNLPEQLGSSAQLEALFTKDVKVEETGKEQTTADPAEAARLAGYPVRLPDNLPGQLSLRVSPETHLTFAIDLPRIQAVLNEIGRSDIHLPAELNGANVTVDIHTVVAALYGNCEAALQEARNENKNPAESQSAPSLGDCTTLVQMPSPEISAPPELDVPRIGQAYLELLGMTPDEATQFSQNIDWTSTLVIPIPRDGTSQQTVSVDGVQGTFIQQRLDGNRQYLLMWVKDGQLYALAGPGGQQSAVSIANSLK